MRKAAILTAAAAALAGGAVIVERTLIAAPHYHGPRSDHFGGRRFHNDSPLWQSERSFLKWQMNRERGVWARVDAPPGPRPPARVDDLRVTFVNHATLLIQIDGLNILTDPIWSERCSPVSFAGPKRHRPPGIRFDDLPKIDIVLVSHNHYDHLDVPTLRALQSRFHPRIFTPLGNSALMARYGIHAEDLDWWQSKANITLVPAQHFCSRGLSDRNATLWGGFVITGRGGNVYFAGDTGWGGHFAEIARRFSPIRLACLPIGSYLPRWFMSPAHIDPAEAVKAHHVLHAKTSVAMHYGTFELGDDGEMEAVDELRRALVANGNPYFWILGFGEGRDVPSE
ncbi:MAG TPA: MBL fold metallo-hydrolase [Thermoanaerobaculia bacterium]|nr:MBL fold metallo-hydrolase [Thermoanaerobaculia bacterium]